MSTIGDRLIEVARHKERLIARAEVQREAIAAGFRGLEAPASVIDRGLEVVRFLKAHPVVVAAGVAVIVALRRRSIMSIASTGLAAWRVWRTLATWAVRL
jgi:hypothetical protein